MAACPLKIIKLLEIIMKYLNDLTISKNQLLEIKNDVYVFSGKELNDINDIKLSDIDHRLFLLDDLINTAYTKNNSIKMSKQSMSINRNEISAQKSRHFPTVDIVAEYDYIDITQGGSQFGATTKRGFYNITCTKFSNI